MPKRTPAVKAVARLQPTVRAKGEPFLDLLEGFVLRSIFREGVRRTDEPELSGRVFFCAREPVNGLMPAS